MKKYINILTLIIVSVSMNGQTTNILDTIYANDTKNVALFFPEPIRQGITGLENFVFTYNREKEQYFGLLQAKQGKESNLLVININGAIFSYIVRYKAQLSKLNYFIPMTSSIGNEKPKVKDSIRLKLLKKRLITVRIIIKNSALIFSIEDNI
ncbi:conjugative transposon protein TraN [Algibacter lectus]|uniref:Conjugative transposon protein TraN n=1 Tax=Algibacter lectus TaxID=221126 RepID=A0A090VK81_9FLAO|nr:conjugative transposon protein TraN [Algibacter lectus]